MNAALQRFADELAADERVTAADVAIHRSMVATLERRRNRFAAAALAGVIGVVEGDGTIGEKLAGIHAVLENVAREFLGDMWNETRH